MATLQPYLNLIPPPNSIQPKLMAWLTANVQPLVDVMNCFDDITAAYFLDVAAGVQLDILGQIIGLGRTVKFQPSLGASPVLDDDTYRVALKAQILKNQWKGTKQEVYDFFLQNLPQYAVLIQDNQNMTMDVLFVGLPPGILQDLADNGYLVPKPAGVRVNYSFTTNVIFAYGPETAYFGGYGNYWIGSAVTTVFGYNSDTPYVKGYNESVWG